MKLKEILWYSFVIPTMLPLVIGLTISATLYILPASLLNRSIKKGVQDAAAMFNDVRNVIV